VRLDLRSLQPNPPDLAKQKHALRRAVIAGRPVQRVVERDPATIDGVVIHQTACVFGKKRSQPDRYHRALGVACHALAFNDGTSVLANPLAWLVYHGNGFNSRSLGLEIEGRFPGLVGKPSTLAAEPETPCDAVVIAAAADALRWLVEEGRAEGMPLRYVWAHRQSSPTRRSDPGEAPWVALLPTFAELGLEVQPALVLNSKSGAGRPIPEAWGGSGPY
jgi:N-acetyl-anhydromuramyl-L-alanine amidase AmpD